MLKLLSTIVGISAFILSVYNLFSDTNLTSLSSLLLGIWGIIYGFFLMQKGQKRDITLLIIIISILSIIISVHTITDRGLGN